MDVDRQSLHAVGTAEKDGVLYSIYFPVFRRELVRAIVPTLFKVYNHFDKNGGFVLNETVGDIPVIAESLCESEAEKKLFSNFVEKILMSTQTIDPSGVVKPYSEIKFSDYQKDLIEGELVFFCAICRYWSDIQIDEMQKQGLVTSLAVTELAATLSTKSQTEEDLLAETAE